MFVIEVKEFQPFTDHSEVKIKIKKPSYKAYLKAVQSADFSELDKDSGIERAVKMLPVLEDLALECITSVEGIKLGDKEPKNGKELLESGAPTEVMQPIYALLMQQLFISDEDKKKS